MKDLPFFKFNVTEWTQGDITLLSLAAQGLFINICCYYWTRGCKVEYDKLQKRLSYPKSVYSELVREGVLKVEDNKVIIEFLDEQLRDRKQRSEINRKNGKKGGLKSSKKKADAKQEVSESVANADKEYLNNELYNANQYLTTIARRLNSLGVKCDVLDVSKLIPPFLDKLEIEEDLDKPLKDVKTHFANWVKIELEKKQKNNKTGIIDVF